MTGESIRLVGGPFDGERRVLHEGNAVVLERREPAGFWPNTNEPRFQVRSYRYNVDRKTSSARLVSAQFIRFEKGA